MMNKENDYGELPMISMNSLNNDMGIFEMPSADQLAAARAREDCERNLIPNRYLGRQESEADLEVALGLQDFNSSGFDTETWALAGAVNALQVQAPSYAAFASHTSHAHLLSMIADELPAVEQPFFQQPDVAIAVPETRGIFEMPCADQVAEERAREEECERELIRLQESEADLELTLQLQDSNSSSSEAEAFALAGVTALQVQPPAFASDTSLAHLFSAIADKLPADAQPLLQHPGVALAVPELVGQVSALVSCDEALWSDEETLAFGALLAGASLADDSTVRTPALRALHTLLNCRASIEQGIELVRVLLRAIADSRLRLELSDALRCAASPHTDRLAALTLDFTLIHLLDPPTHDVDCVSLERVADAVSVGWSRLSSSDAYVVLQLIGRRLAESRATDSAESELSERKRLKDLLEVAAQGHETQRPDLIKVMVAASRLLQLFMVEK